MEITAAVLRATDGANGPERVQLADRPIGTFLLDEINEAEAASLAGRVAEPVPLPGPGCSVGGP